MLWRLLVLCGCLCIVPCSIDAAFRGLVFSFLKVLFEPSKPWISFRGHCILSNGANIFQSCRGFDDRVSILNDQHTSCCWSTFLNIYRTGLVAGNDFTITAYCSTSNIVSRPKSDTVSRMSISQSWLHRTNGRFNEGIYGIFSECRTFWKKLQWDCAGKVWLESRNEVRGKFWQHL